GAPRGEPRGADGEHGRRRGREAQWPKGDGEEPAREGPGREAHAEILREVAAIVDAGGLRPVIDESRHSLDQALEAHARLESGRAMGKVVIEH
ncbi:MAG: zinc-binding dehydrogenase, partial [Planctomycetota bacterium]